MRGNQSRPGAGWFPSLEPPRSRPPSLVMIMLVACVASVIIIVAIMIVKSYPSHEEIVAPDGRPAFLVKCSSQGDCYSHASEVCPSGYEKLDEGGQTKKHTSYQKVGEVQVPTEHESYEGMMLIRCN